MNPNYKVKQRHSVRWIVSYMECLFEHRAVSILSEHEKSLQLLLW